jgi:hypothetical protein
MTEPKAKPKVQFLPGRRGVEPPPVIPQPVAGQGRLRKIALIGSAATVDLAPWYDGTWEIWAHATCYAYCKRVDRYFDLHPWDWITGKPVPGYVEWLKGLRTPIYMQRKFRDVPASVRYPRERVMAEHPRYFTSHAAWMIALALSEGVTHLGFFGIHYALDEEHKKQRTGCEFWMGVAHGRGVQIVNPEGSPLIREPNWLYGYESHTGKKHVREQTKGKRPQAPMDLSLPPQNRTLTIIEDPSLAACQALGRTDIPWSAGAQDRLQAQLDGRMPELAGVQHG